jgi:hypothetical protein
MSELIGVLESVGLLASNPQIGLARHARGNKAVYAQVVAYLLAEEEEEIAL